MGINKTNKPLDDEALDLIPVTIKVRNEEEDVFVMDASSDQLAWLFKTKEAREDDNIGLRAQLVSLMIRKADGSRMYEDAAAVGKLSNRRVVILEDVALRENMLGKYTPKDVTEDEEKNV